MVSVRIERKAMRGMPALYVVSKDGKEVGLLEKYNNTRTETHPWKAFKGIGMQCQFIRSFYPEEGGKQAALAAVIG